MSYERILRLMNFGLSERAIGGFAEFFALALRIDPAEGAIAKELLSHSWLRE